MASETNEGLQATVRLARTWDAERIATLSHQLGYPASQREIERRLKQTQQDEHHAVYVAELSDRHVVGWVHVYIRPLVVVDLQAEIGGLVVDQGYRRHRIGNLLMEHAEEWARSQGCWAVYLRSNVIREGAHAFYRSIGYNVIKTSLTFQKTL